MQDFVAFAKIARLSRECVVTEKIDGTNGCIFVGDGEFLVGSRSRWITPLDDNFGFARWAYDHRDELISGLGPGTHHGEWWGSGIQRRYGASEKYFSLFNTSKWGESRPECCRVVPVLLSGIFTTELVENALSMLRVNGSFAAPGFLDPEGIVIYHVAGNLFFKKTLKKDEEWKGKA